MLRIINAMLVVGLLVSAFVLYSLEHNLRKHARYFSALEREISQEGENIKLLKAEWSHLTRPARLERLALAHLNMRQPQPYQLVARDDLAELLPLRDSVPFEDDRPDLIARMLETLQ